MSSYIHRDLPVGSDAWHAITDTATLALKNVLGSGVIVLVRNKNGKVHMLTDPRSPESDVPMNVDEIAEWIRQWFPEGS